MPAVQEYAKDIIVDELKNKIGTDLGIGKLHFQLFNTVQLDSVYLYDQSNEKILMADKLSASIDLISLMKKKVVITSAWLTDFEVHLSKETSEAPLNIQYIVDAFKPQNDKPESKIEVKLSSVNIVNGQFYYDVKDKPVVKGRFDANHIAVSDFNAKLAMKSLLSDSLNVQIKKFALKEKSGLNISDLTFRLITQNKKISVRGFNLKLPTSFIKLDRCEIDLTAPNDSSKIVDYATLDCIIATSHISPQDISAFVPALKNFDDRIILHGHINGSANNINIEDLSLDYGKTMHLVSNAEIKDLYDPKKTYILGSIDRLTLNYTELESIVDNFAPRTKLPALLKNFGTMSFEGDISGYLNQLTAFGSLGTDLGVIKTDVLFGLDDPRPGINSYIKGKIYTSDFELGKLLANKDLNKASLNIAVDLEKPTHGSIRGTAEGDLFNFDYKGYSYKDIQLDASYDGLRVDGKLAIDDPNGKLDIEGLFDLTDKDMPELIFKARVDNLQLDKLHLAEKMEHSYLSFVIDADFVGKDIDHAQGYIRVDSIDFLCEDKVFFMNKFLVESSIDSINHKLKIQSDILNGEVVGEYSFLTITNSILNTLYPYLPALIKAKNQKKTEKRETENNFTFNFSISNTESLSSILKLPVTVISPAKIVGRYNNIQDRFKVEIFTPVIKAAGMNIKSGYVLAENENSDNRINTQVDVLLIGKNDVTNEVSIRSTANNNLVNTNISLLNSGKQKAKGDFSIATLFTKEENDPLMIDIDMLPSELLLNNAMWKMEKSHINIKDGHYAVNNFSVYTDDKSQEVRINGSYSPKSSSDILKAELKNIDLEYIFHTLAIDVLRFGGAATGSLFVSSIENKPYLNTRLEVTNFRFNGTELGKLNIFSELDDETNKIMMDGQIVSKENKLTKVNGEIDPIKQGLSINFDADSIDISFLNRYASAVFQNVGGRGTGKVHLYGNFSDVTVEGKAFIENGNIGVNFLNTNYKFTDTIYMKKDLIYFTDITLTDEFNNKAIASGKVAHDFFHNFMYLVDLSANNFLVYNATLHQNPIFYGKVFGSGKGTIGGDEGAVDIDISMKTENNTIVRMNFMENIINEYSFITYKSNQKADSTATSTVLSSPIKTDSGMDINMNFYIDATPSAVVEILMDPVGGDVLRGSGSGAMQFQWSTKTSPRLFGTYTINRGSYNFTFQRILERRFSIEDGSTVQFRGDPFEAELDVTAIYKVNANLRDLDQDIAQFTGQTSIPVNCVLNLSSQLRRPNVGLDIQFPAADPEVARQVKSIINTPDMISKQVAYLLLLSKFISPQDSNTPYSTSDFAAVASATLSNQLTKIVSKVDDRWELGTNIRYSDKEFTNTEVELILSSRLLNDRLLINGNFGYRNDITVGKEAMISDVDIEYLLNNAGTWRIKAYNHYNEKFYYNERSSQTQGFGLIYKKDFDNLNDLFRNPIKPKVSINDTIIPIVPDSTKKGSSLSNFIKMKQ